jgi:DNA recombination-dependent growth factor C
MGLIKGNPTLSRYRITDPPGAELSDEFLRERLKKNAFLDIEDTSEEESLGWVELFDHLATEFDPAAYRFGGFLAFSLRYDCRKLQAKTLNRYYALREAAFAAQTGRKPNSVKKRELKESLRLELLRRTLLGTDLIEVVWLYRENEIWLSAAGEKRRALFEDLWGRTFGLPLKFLVPITIGLELVPESLKEKLINLEPSALAGATERD